MAQDALIRIRAKVDGQAEVQALERQFRRTESQTQKLKQSFSGLATVAARLGGAFAVFQGLRFTLIKTAELQTQTKSLEVLTGSLEQAQTVIKELQEFGAVTPFTSSELIQTAKLLKAYNIDTAKLVDTTKRLGDVAGATGGDLEGIARAFGQIKSRGSLQAEELNQLRERGVDIETALRDAYDLSGAEFADAMRKNQISAEAVFAILERITSAGGKYAGGAISQSTTLAGKFSTLQDNVDQLARSFGEALTPAVEDALDNANKLVTALGDVNFEAVKTVAEIGLVTGAVIGLRKAFESMLALKLVTALSNIRIIFAAFGGQIAITAAAQGLLNKALAVGTGLMSALPVTALALGVVGLADALRQAATDQKDFNKLLQEGTVLELQAALAKEQNNLALLERQQLEGRGAGRAADKSRLDRARERIQMLEGQLADGMIGGGSLPQGSGLVDPPKLPSPDGTDPAKAIKERERLLQQVLDIELKLADAQQKGRVSAQDAVTASQDRLALLKEEDPVKRIALEFDQKRAAAHERTVRAIEATDDPLQQQLANQQFFLDLEILSVEEQKKLKEAAEQTNNVFESMQSTIEVGLSNAIMGLLQGTKSLSESLSGILNQMASLVIQAGVRALLPFADGGVISQGKVTPFAYGGVVNKPTLFPMANGMGLMGEAGPEGILPLRRSRSGRLGVEASGSGATTVNVSVDASGSSVQGDGAQAAQLGKAIGFAVQTEILKQKRPGGLLATV